MTNNLHDDLLYKVQTIRVSLRHGRRAPHKPLLLLLSIGRHLNGHDRLTKFGEIEADLNKLIRRFGLPDSRGNAYLPFWRLRNDGLWEIDRPELVGTTTVGDAHISDLRDHDIRGGLVQDFLSVLDMNPDFAWSVVQSLLNDYFPPSLHDDVLRDVGLVGKLGLIRMNGTKSIQEVRDPRFREVVLQAYKFRCALCGLDVQFDGQPIGLEAAHIKWHSVGGPAQVENGLALCVLHHKFFDSGLFTVLADLTVLVGGLAVGDSVDESLNKFGGSVLPFIPDRPDQRPAPRYLEWHKRAVFKATTAIKQGWGSDECRFPAKEDLHHR